MSNPYSPSDLRNAPHPQFPFEGMTTAGQNPAEPTWTAPVGIAQAAAQVAAEEGRHLAAEAKPTTTDHLAEDAKAAAKLPDFPVGSPELRPIYRLNYRERATAIRLFAELQDIDQPGEDESPTMNQVAGMFEGLAKIDDFLATVAVDADAYHAWVLEADDTAFAELWNAYSVRQQPGEAPSSSS